MDQSTKRTEAMSPQEVQSGNRSWWSSNPMAYDWRGEIEAPRFSSAWFDRIDASFLDAAQLCLTRRAPFDQVIPLDRLQGARVLEIGCGMGLHTERMVRAGADVTAVDLSPTSIEATQKRLALKGLRADVREVDAEALPFADGSFDFVWSWGVIHHSSRTARIVRGIARVLRPEGEARVMVYNREAAVTRLLLFRDHVLSGRFLHNTVEETLFRNTDGFSARHYVREQFEDLFRAFFQDVTCSVLGQEADAVPLPRALRRFVGPLVPLDVQRRLAARHGSFLFLVARRPE
jgi:2-polyprenyl-3-methyl-5-hydroxy-6-metoxy-1,4-benzoquinol methylase